MWLDIRWSALDPFSLSANPSPPPPPKRSPWPKVAAGAAAVVVLVLAAIVINGGGNGGDDNPTPPSTTAPDAATTAPAPEPTTTEPPTTPSTVPVSQIVEETCAQPGLITRGCDIRFRSGANTAGPLPVVILLHGFTGNEDEVRSIGNWDAALAERDFILVTPGGITGSWNAGICCGIAQATEIDDVGYLSDLITRISARPDVDPERISMVGFSNGGLMTYRYLCADAGRIASAVSVSGTRTVDCMPSVPTSVLQVHGTEDRTVPYAGGQGILAAIMGVSFAPVETTMANLAAAQQCPTPPAEQSEGSRTVRTWNGCADGVEVELWTLQGWGHDWMNTPTDTTAGVLDFVGIS